MGSTAMPAAIGGPTLWDGMKHGRVVTVGRRGRALTDSRRGSVQRTTQPFAHLVNIRSRPLANDCRSLLVNADGPPVYIPLARKRIHEVAHVEPLTE